MGRCLASKASSPRLIEQQGQIITGTIGQQVASHAARVIEEVDADLGIDQVGGQQVERPGFIAQSLGVDQPFALAGLAQQPREVLHGQVLVAGQLAADER